MANFPKNDYPKPPDVMIEDLAKLLPGEIQRHYSPGPVPGEYATRFYNVSDLIRLLMDTGIDVSEGAAVHAIRWLVELEYLIPVTVAVRDPDRYGLPTLAEPWLSAVLNGRLLDTVAMHGPPDPLDEHYLKRLDATESEAYFATAAFWDWWSSGTPVSAETDSGHIGDSVEAAKTEPAMNASKREKVWWATEPPDSKRWRGPVTGTLKAILEALNASIDPNVTRKTLRQRHESKAYYVHRLGSGQEWRCYFPTPEEYATVNCEFIRINESKSSENGQ